MLYRLPKTRKYAYRPQFYKEKSDQEDTEKRIKFRRNHVPKKKRRSYIGFLLLLFIVIFILQYLAGFQATEPDNMDIRDMEIVR